MWLEITVLMEMYIGDTISKNDEPGAIKVSCPSLNSANILLHLSPETVHMYVHREASTRMLQASSLGPLQSRCLLRGR